MALGAGGDGDETSQFKVSFMSKIHADQDSRQFRSRFTLDLQG